MMKINIYISSILAFVSAFLMTPAWADVSGYTANTNQQTIAPVTALWLDLNTAAGSQITKSCYFSKGPAAIFFSAETGHVNGPNGSLETRIWIDPLPVGGVNPPAFWLAPANGNLLMTTYNGASAESHATHGGFNAWASGWYNVRVYARSTGQSTFNVDDLSLICVD